MYTILVRLRHRSLLSRRKRRGANRNSKATKPTEENIKRVYHFS